MLVPAVGVGAFALVVPITIALLVVLAFLILSYRQTIKAYPDAPAARTSSHATTSACCPRRSPASRCSPTTSSPSSVSVAAGTAALGVRLLRAGALHARDLDRLRAAHRVRQPAGRQRVGPAFAVPTYFFILNMVVLLGVGFWKLVDRAPAGRAHPPRTGQCRRRQLGRRPPHGRIALRRAPRVRVGWRGGHGRRGHLQRRAGVQGAGVEERPHHARHHGHHPRRDVPRPVDPRRARCTRCPYESGTPTVISQIGRLVYGGGSQRATCSSTALQAGTMLILVLAANTSFADFPRLASFHAEDNFMPRQLTKRGHRLVFSNGIIFLARRGDRGVDRHQRQGRPPHPALRHRRVHQLHAVAGRHGQAPPHASREPHWRYGLFVNGVGAFLSLVVA